MFRKKLKETLLVLCGCAILSTRIPIQMTSQIDFLTSEVRVLEEANRALRFAVLELQTALKHAQRLPPLPDSPLMTATVADAEAVDAEVANITPASESAQFHLVPNCRAIKGTEDIARKCESDEEAFAFAKANGYTVITHTSRLNSGARYYFKKKHERLTFVPNDSFAGYKSWVLRNE
jgi:hypothetical protein